MPTQNNLCEDRFIKKRNVIYNFYRKHLHKFKEYISIPNYTNCITQNVQYTYSWNFGDGTTSIEQNPTHIYLSSGVFNVSVTITGPCTSTTINKVVNIPPGGITVSVYTN